MISALRSGVAQKFRGAVSPGLGQPVLPLVIEKVIDGTDSRIRLVNGYRKKLQPSVDTALEFVDDLVSRIPGSIFISQSTFQTDPYVNAFFVNTDDVRGIVAHSSEISDFVELYGSRTELQCCCLLCMRKTARPVLGMALSGDILRRDVRQIAVSFSDHHIYSPAPDETAAREGLRTCLLDGLITGALASLMQNKRHHYQLQSDRHTLYARLRHLEYKARTATLQGGEGAAIAEGIATTRGKIRMLEDGLMRLRPSTPQVSLDHVNDLFRQPEQYIRMEKSSLKLDKMGMLIDSSSTQPCNDIDIAEVVIGDELPRVVTLAQFSMSEFAPRAGLTEKILYS
jgi:hypothetical protein